MNTKKCLNCGLKPVGEFYAHKGAFDGLQSYCRDCQSAQQRARRESKPDEYRIKLLERRQQLKERHSAGMPVVTKTCKKCGTLTSDFTRNFARKDGYSNHCRNCNRAKNKAWTEKNLEKVRGKARKATIRNSRKVRAEVLEAYGGKCACCGEATPQFLTIDHIYNDGAEHRKTLGGRSSSIYRWLKLNGFPKDRFQLLCWNCNAAKQFYGGCPHATKAAPLPH